LKLLFKTASKYTVRNTITAKLIIKVVKKWSNYSARNMENFFKHQTTINVEMVALIAIAPKAKSKSNAF
jgi:hypothetical protein